MVSAQKWLEEKYSKDERDYLREIYLNQPDLEGELDLKKFKNLKRIYISHLLDESKLRFKHLDYVITEHSWGGKEIEKGEAKITKLIYTKNAQEYLEQNFSNEEERKDIKTLDLTNLDLEGDLDLVDFTWCYSDGSGGADIYLMGNPRLGEIKNKNKGTKVYLDAQNWLTNKYHSCKEPKLTGLENFKELNISDFPQLEKINVSGSLYKKSNLTQLRLIDCPNLTELDCYYNNLTELTIINCPKLKKIYASSNQLISLDLSNNHQLELLDIRHNNFTSDLSFLSHLVNLKWLWLENNHFTGSLKPLQNMNKLEELNCSDNQLTDLNLSDCKNLKTLYCDNNKFISLNFLKSVNELKILSIKNCPIEGSLKPLQNMNKLYLLYISNTNLSEGLEYLPISCKELYCNSDYQYKSIELTKELDKSNCSSGEGSNKSYSPTKWREDKQNNLLSSTIPTERLFTIRINIKKFLGEWGTKEGNASSKLSELKSPEEFNKYRFLSIGKWGSRATSATGGILALTGQPIAGGVMAAASPFIEAISSHIEDNWYQAEETKWGEFVTDTETLLDTYDELLEILAPIEIKELLDGKVSQAVKKLKEETYKFLEKHDKDKDNKISASELDKARKELMNDLRENWETKEKELKEIMEAIRNLAKEIINYQGGSFVEEEEKENNKEENSQSEESKLAQIEKKIEQIKKVEQELEQKKNELEIQLKKEQTNYQQIRKELVKRQNDLLFLKKRKQLTSEELVVLEGKTKDLKNKLTSVEQSKNDIKKQLSQAKNALLKHQVNQSWLVKCIQDCVSGIQTKMNTPIQEWDCWECGLKETKINKGKQKEVINSEQVEETSLQAQIEIPPKNEDDLFSFLTD